MLLEGKKILITGGSRGIGGAIVKRAVEEGADVGFTYRSSATQANALVEELSSYQRNVRAYQSDASSYGDAKILIEKVMDELGGIDVLVNNAGITEDNLILRMSEDQWDTVMDVNLKSVFNLTKHVLRPMMRNKNGVIINMSSVVGVFGNAGQANYAASKAGILGFTKSIAKEVGSRNIRCNAIAPGFIETEMTEELDKKTKQTFLTSIPLKRLGKAEEVADLVCYLSSDKAAYITGQTISIGGGINV